MKNLSKNIKYEKLIEKTFIFCFVFLIFFNHAAASVGNDVKINLNGANAWQETDNFHKIIKGQEVKNQFPEQKWWLQFNDIILTDYMELAIKENQDTKTALARIEQSTALARAVMGNEFPHLSLNGWFVRIKSSSNFLTPNFSNTSASSGSVLSGGSSNLYISPLVANYELDYLFKNRSKTKMAQKDAETAKFYYQTVLITITSELATVYFNLLQSDKLLDLNKELLSILEKTFELKQSLFQEGEISYDEVLLSRQAISQVKSNISTIQKLQSINVHRLCILLGKPPLEQSGFPRSDIDKISLNNEFKLGNPIELVSRRPDILSTEAKLQKTGINASVSFKDFFPVINIYGVFGYASSTLSNFCDWKSSISSIAANAAQSIFSGGTKIASYRANKAEVKAVVQEYQKTIITAFQEVEDSLSKLNSGFINYSEANKQVMDSQSLFILSKYRYQEGEDSLIDLLDARKRLIDSKQTAVISKSELLIHNISLYKALGGGY